MERGLQLRYVRHPLQEGGPAQPQRRDGLPQPDPRARRFQGRHRDASQLPGT